MQVSRVVMGEAPVTIEDIVAIARGRARVALDDSAACKARIEASHALLVDSTRQGRPIYGVNTGFGNSCDVGVDPNFIAQMPTNLVRFHGCGIGQDFSEPDCAAIVAVRLASLARGHSGVRRQLLVRLAELLNHRIIPRIPSLGSVGASGDLTPLSYVAAVAMGEREVYHHGLIKPTADVLATFGLAPLVFEPKESLAIMNGTSVMTALACQSIVAAQRLARAASALTALLSDVVHGNASHFHERIFALKPHPGQMQAAAWIREDLAFDGVMTPARQRVQDRYSLRCAPHVIGVLLDTLTFVRSWVEIEINGVNDNPLVDPETQQVYMGGNFYGGHVGHAMDSLKLAVANVVDLMDRQMLLLCDPSANGGLPRDLVAAKGAAATANFGFKAMQILTSALAAEALKNTMPATAFSRSTEGHNQDKVSMGTIAARDCQSVLAIAQAAASALLLALCQAVDLRGKDQVHARARALHAFVRDEFPMIVEDRPMEGDIKRLAQRLEDDQWPLR